MEKKLLISKLVIALGLISSGVAYADSTPSLSSSQQSASQSVNQTTTVLPDPNSAAIPAQTTLPVPGLSPGVQESSTNAAAQGNGQQLVVQSPAASQTEQPPAQQMAATSAYPSQQNVSYGHPAVTQSSQGYQQEQYASQEVNDGPPCLGFVHGRYAANNSWIPAHCPGQTVFIKGYYNPNGGWVPGHWVQTAYAGQSSRHRG